MNVQKQKIPICWCKEVRLEGIKILQASTHKTSSFFPVSCDQQLSSGFFGRPAVILFISFERSGRTRTAKLRAISSGAEASVIDHRNNQNQP